SQCIPTVGAVGGRISLLPLSLSGSALSISRRDATGRGRGASRPAGKAGQRGGTRSEEHTSELQSRENLVCRLLLEKKKEKGVTLDIGEQPIVRAVGGGRWTEERLCCKAVVVDAT